MWGRGILKNPRDGRGGVFLGGVGKSNKKGGMGRGKVWEKAR